MRSRLSAALLLSVAMAACNDSGPDFLPASFIEKLRILDVKATPAEVYPGEATLLESLVVDPYEGAKSLSFLWIQCDPDPGGSQASPCSATNDLRNLASLTGGTDGGSLPPGVHVYPFGDSVYYHAPSNTFDNFPPGSPERTDGVDATIVLVAYEGTDPTSIGSADTVKAVALKRLRIRTRDQKQNKDPAIESVRLAGKPIGDEGPAHVKSGSTIQLSATATPGSAETYVRTMPDGSSLTVTEPMVFSWYTAAGSFDEVQRESARTTDGQDIPLHVPSYDQTADGVLDLWVVLRDSRGGSDFTHRKLLVDP